MMKELCECLLLTEQMETNSAINTAELRKVWKKSGLYIISGYCILRYQKKTSK